MARDNANLIRLLEAELDVIEGGGYGRAAGQPVGDKPIFDNSLVCINHWLVPGHKPDCCEDCILLEAVPEKYKSEQHPCQFIPLNRKGDTAKSLEEEGDRDRLVEEVKTWLRTTIQRLKAGNGALSSGSAEY
jgi:hypothetical protein